MRLLRKTSLHPVRPKIIKREKRFRFLEGGLAEYQRLSLCEVLCMPCALDFYYSHDFFFFLERKEKAIISIKRQNMHRTKVLPSSLDGPCQSSNQNLLDD